MSPLSDTAAAELRPRLKGRVITPGDEAYDEARTPFYGGFDSKPALIARVAEALRTKPPVAQRFVARSAVESDRRFTAGAQYKDSTRHYYEVAHQDYLGALQDAIHELEAPV